MKNLLLISALALGVGTSSLAKGKQFELSTGVGWPFVFVPQFSIQDDNHRYYVNYKLGLDHGLSVGYEWQNKQHLYGAFIGAVGARKVTNDCSINQTCDNLNIRVFDNETTQGVGLSYEYRFQSSKAQGWAVRMEAGYGHVYAHLTSTIGIKRKFPAELVMSVN